MVHWRLSSTAWVEIFLIYYRWVNTDVVHWFVLSSAAWVEKLPSSHSIWSRTYLEQLYSHRWSSTKLLFRKNYQYHFFFLVKDIQLLYGRLTAQLCRLTAQLYPRKQIWPLASSSNTIEAQGNLDGFPLSQRVIQQQIQQNARKLAP